MEEEKIKLYKELEQLSYSVYRKKEFPVPEGWVSIKKYENKSTGFYAEAFMSPKGEIYLVPRATEAGLGGKLDINDIYNDYQLYKKQMPSQYGDLVNAYKDLVSIYGEDIKGTGYSLGASLIAMLGNSTGMEVVTFEAYGVGDFVTPKHTENIINFGNENDPIFSVNADYHLGKVYVIPNEGEPTECYYGGERELNLLDVLRHHSPNKIGDLSKAVEYKGSQVVLNGHIYYDDILFDPTRRVFYSGEITNWDDISQDDLDAFVNQYYDMAVFPSKEDLDARVRTGELIYVESYYRSDGTHVHGYYRRYPQ